MISYNHYALESRFEGNTVLDTMVLQSLNNPIMRNAQQIRKVRNHNKLNVISVPIEIGYYKQINKFSFGLQAGMAYTIVLSQKGKTLNSLGKIITYNTVENALNSNTLSVVGGAYLQYHFNPRFALLMDINTSLQTQKNILDGQLSQSSTIISTNLGLSYRFRK